MLGRVAALLTLAGAIVLVALVLTRSDDPYRIRVQTVNAGQIVVGNRVKVGGAVAGKVTDVRLLDSGVAELELTLDPGLGRLHEGTRAAIRAQSVVGSANHFVSLVPGPRGNRPIPDGGRIGVSSTTAPVDFDALLDSLDQPTRAGLGDVIKGFAAEYQDRAPEARRALEYFAPALDGTTTLLRELQRDRAATSRLLVKGAIAARATAAKRQTLTALISRTTTTTGALADESEALGRTIQALPVTFRKANTTFVNLRSTLDDLDPLVAAATPATRNLAPFLRDLQPLARASVPTVGDLAATVAARGRDDDLVDLVRRLEPLGRVVRTGAPRAIRGLNASQHYLDALLAYTPDIAAAVTLLDEDTSYYDANGHYARTQPNLNKLAFDPAAGSLSLQDDSQRLRGLQTHRGARCPGAAAQPPADGSAPRAVPGCDPHRRAARAVKRIVVLLAGALALYAFVAGSSGAARDGVPEDGAGYEITAVFDDAAAAAVGEDVKVAGARIGAIASMDVTADKKALIVLDVQDRRFVPFHADATRTLRPEGVLAVKFVECDPGRASRPPLERIAGSGRYRLPLGSTSSPIDSDLVNTIMRKPTGQQLAILLSELGVGLAGRGADLNAVLHRANPALRETDRVLALLARQSRQLAQFARDADTVLGPLAADRDAIAGFITQARRSGEASAERATDLSASIQRLPRFLSALRTQMADVAALTDQGTPALAALEPAAPALGRATAALGPFARAAPAVKALGDDAAPTDARLQRTRPLLRRLLRAGRASRGPARDLDGLTASFDKELGIKNLTELLYHATSATNGFDDVGHYLRAEGLSGTCSEYSAAGFTGCDAQWGPVTAAKKPIALDPQTRAVLDYLLAK